MSRIKTWARARLRPLFLGVCVTLLVLGIAGVVITSASGGSEVDPEQIEAAKQELVTERDQAQGDLETAHQTLLNDLGGVDVERTARDRALVRGLVLELTATSISSRTIHQEQIAFDARYEALGPTSSTLTEFLPEWMATTEGTTYSLASLQVDVAAVSGLDYRYTAIARLDPVAEGDKAQYVFLTISTSPDAEITEIGASRMDNRSRDALVAQEDGSDETETPAEEEVEG